MGGWLTFETNNAKMTHHERYEERHRTDFHEGDEARTIPEDDGNYVKDD